MYKPKGCVTSDPQPPNIGTAAINTRSYMSDKTNFCTKHSQAYVDYCVYCGPPKMRESQITKKNPDGTKTVRLQEGRAS